ncbi:MAG: hypothetical protein FWB85_07840 [Chitinispirillia bacterium]|nr:hypothetical protein [Chitinispirillia bacterium]MCL2242176.1 hypothetical protein [Chitinispirillia bacterium]
MGRPDLPNKCRKYGAKYICGSSGKSPCRFNSPAFDKHVRAHIGDCTAYSFRTGECCSSDAREDAEKQLSERGGTNANP